MYYHGEQKTTNDTSTKIGVVDVLDGIDELKDGRN